MIYDAQAIKEHDAQRSVRVTQGELQYEYWTPARPENYRFDPLTHRLRWAWGVLIGRYDALRWDE